MTYLLKSPIHNKVSLFYKLEQLAEELIRYIFGYLIHGVEDMFFKRLLNNFESNYSPRYLLAMYTRCQETNHSLYHNGYMLSCIKNKKKNHYYISRELIHSICDVCETFTCRSMYCRGGYSKKAIWTSAPLGKNLACALSKFYFNEHLRFDLK